MVPMLPGQMETQMAIQTAIKMAAPAAVAHVAAAAAEVVVAVAGRQGTAHPRPSQPEAMIPHRPRLKAPTTPP